MAALRPQNRIMLRQRHAVRAAVPARRQDCVFFSDGEEQAETFAGLLLREHGELPPEGTAIKFGEYVSEVRELKSNRIHSVLVKRAAEELDAEQRPAGNTEPESDTAPGGPQAPDHGPPANPDHAKGED